MDAQREQRVESLFQQTLELPTDQHDSFLRVHCDDSEILRRVETLLKHHAEAGGNFLAGPTQPSPGQPHAPGNEPRVPGDGTIAHYRLIRVIGEGGMGIVYEAEEDRPRRKVALKVIRRGFATPAMLRRFEYEADVLARLDHPGIARIHHAGIADSGLGPQPYFAMELVQGIRLDEWVTRHNPVTIKRLKLLIEICDAVHHAHTKGVIHRDLKPSNILITPDGRPKILDFGVARATDADIQSTTLHTESGQIIGTLPYMAPEQASGKVNDLDTSSDVYALGVIAYELLSGTMPYSLEGKALHEAVRVICEQEPSRLSSVNKSLRGDVETIVQKALEKDKSRRYHTAGEMGADVKRFLDYEPITARRPGTWYQLAKFARRNKVLVGGVTVIILVLAAGIVTSTSFAIRAERQKRQAQTQTLIANQIRDFLKGMLGSADPRTAQGKPVLVLDVLDRAAADVGKQFNDQPAVEVELRTLLAQTYLALGRPDAALMQAEAAEVLAERHFGADSPLALEAASGRGLAMQHLGSFAEGEAVFRDAVERTRRALGDHHRQTLEREAIFIELLRKVGDLAEGQTLGHDALRRSAQALGADDPCTHAIEHNLALCLQGLGRFPEAERLMTDAMQRRRARLGEDHPDAFESMAALGSIVEAQDRLPEALGLYQEAGRRAHKIYGEKHQITLSNDNNTAIVLWRLGRRDEGLELIKSVARRAEQSLGADHPFTVHTTSNLAGIMALMGQPGESIPLLERNLDVQRRSLGQDHIQTLNTQFILSGALVAVGEFERGVQLQSDLVKRASRTLGRAHPMTLGYTNRLADFHNQAGSPENALEHTRRILELTPELEPTDPPTAAIYSTYYAIQLQRMHRYAEAYEPLKQAWNRLRSANLTSHQVAYQVLTGLVSACENVDRPEEAAKWRAELAALQATTRPAPQPATPAPSTGPAATGRQ